jgi:branched-chain amino acid transport system ATP-binding protein
VDTAIVTATGITKRFGGFTALNAVDLSLAPRERLALIGPNGSGKSTFVNCLSGVLACDRGSTVFEGKDIGHLPAWQRARLGIARSFQIPRPFRGLTVRENVEVPLMFALGHTSRVPVRDRAEAALAQVGLLERAASSPRGLTQVELRKLELARALVTGPKLLIADESMAGLSDSEVDDILDVLFRLNQSGIAILLIEHIMHAVMRFAERVAVLVAGSKIADGPPQEVMSHPEVVRAYLGE